MGNVCSNAHNGTSIKHLSMVNLDSTSLYWFEMYPAFFLFEIQVQTKQNYKRKDKNDLIVDLLSKT